MLAAAAGLLVHHHNAAEADDRKMLAGFAQGATQWRSMTDLADDPHSIGPPMQRLRR
jgi:hypothetical protein